VITLPSHLAAVITSERQGQCDRVEVAASLLLNRGRVINESGKGRKNNNVEWKSAVSVRVVALVRNGGEKAHTCEDGKKETTTG